MKVLHKKELSTGITLLIGESSWNKDEISIKYGWKDKNGKLCRGGEFPINALPKLLAFAYEKGYHVLK